jgi:multiple sugar transport system permease protein
MARVAVAGKAPQRGLLLPGVRVGRRPRWFITVAILPALILVLAGSVYPLIYMVFVSFHEYNLAYSNVSFRFIGLVNYANVLASGDFWYSFRVSAIFTSVAVASELVLGTFLAWLFNRRFWGSHALRTLLLVPMTIAPVVVGLVWRWLYNAEYGLVNFIVTSLGGSPRAWLVNPHLALGAVIVSDVWEWTPFIMLVVTAGLQTVPPEVVEAAALDGANPWQEFRSVVFPIIRNIIVIGLVFRSLDAFRMADTIFTLTGGGPGRVTTVVPYDLYLQGFQFFRVGYAAAMSVILLALTTLAVGCLMRVAGV